MPSTGLLLADDFIWISRIVTTAQAHGIVIKSAASAEKLVELARRESPRFLILDLGLKDTRVADIMSRVQEACAPPPKFVAYGSHVDVATLRAAREAGCDPVLPRSRMAEDLEMLLCEWAGLPTSAEADTPPK